MELTSREKFMERYNVCCKINNEYGSKLGYVGINKKWDNLTNWIFNTMDIESFKYKFNDTLEDNPDMMHYANRLEEYAINRLHSRLLSEMIEHLFAMTTFTTKADRCNRRADIFIKGLGYDVKLISAKSTKYKECKASGNIADYFYRRYDGNYILVVYEDKSDLLDKENLNNLYREYVTRINEISRNKYNELVVG